MSNTNSVIDYENMIKRLPILISILCLFVADIVWVAPKPTLTESRNIYYLRADGTASNKAAATSGSSASTAMSVATHNSQTFEAGDHIRLCDTGGTYKKSLVAPSSGKDGYPIIYEAAPGQHPVIDLSIDIGSGRWNDMGEGVYQTKGYGRVLWEEGVPLHPATNTSCTDGNWFYKIGSGILQYKPTSGTPASHGIQTMWFESDWGPYGIDIRNKSNIEISGLTLNRCGIGTGDNLSSPVPLIKNVSIHDNTINNAMWAIWGNLKNNTIEQDVKISNNQINNCNSGISIWTNSDTTVGHTQHPLRVNVSNNSINNLYSIDKTHDWSYALLTSYYYTDHEGISFQDPKDCIIANNVISGNFTQDFSSDEYWTRAIYFFITSNGTSKTYGNQVLRNRIVGAYLPAIYISGKPAGGGVENNTFAFNVLESSVTKNGFRAFQVNNYGVANPTTGVNYFVNNTVNYPRTNTGFFCFFVNGDSGYWTVRNNIMQAKLASGITNTVIGYTPFIFDHNCYNWSGSVGWPFTYSTNAQTFTGWKNLSKNFDNTGSFIRDPLLRSSDSALTKKSPGVNAGTPIEGITVSGGVGLLGIDGKPFDPKHPSMGAYAQPVYDDKKK